MDTGTWLNFCQLQKEILNYYREQNLMRSSILLLSVLAGMAVVLEGCQSDKRPKQDLDPRPNVVLFLVDDLGWADLGCYGNRFHETPNIDGLAAQGMRFTDAYAASAVCSPTRASIMTGKYPVSERPHHRAAPRR